MKQPKVCMIISALNEEEFIGQLIDSIKNQSYKNVEIIIIDDGSTDKTKEICRAKNVTMLENSPGRLGPAFGWNRAAEYTKADIICVLGADFFLEDKYFVEKSVKAFDEKTVAVYTGYHTMFDTWVEKAVTREWGVSMEPRFIRRKDFLEMGMFPAIGFGEDQVFIKRLDKYLSKKGLEKKYVKGTFFSGHGVHTLKAMYKQAKWYGKTSVPFIRIMGKGAGLAQTLKLALKTWIRVLYFISFVFLLLSAVFPVLFIAGVPFLAILATIFAESVVEAIREKNPYRILRAALFLVFGLGMLHGLLLYLFRIDNRMGGG